MDYLNGKNWRRVNFLGNSGEKTVGGKLSYQWLKISVAMLSIFLVISATVMLWPQKVYNPYRGVGNWIITGIEKPLEIQNITISWLDFKDGKYPLGKNIFFVPKGEGDKIGSDLDAIRFAEYNASKMYFSAKTAGDWIVPSRALNEDGKEMTELMGAPNWAMAFSVVPYGDFASKERKVEGVGSLLAEPFWKNEGQGFPGFSRKCADGEMRMVDLRDDTHIFLRPNVWRMFRRSAKDIELGAPSLEPEESLPFAAYIFTDLYDRETKEWNVAKTQWWVSRQFLSCSGKYIDPENISIVGKGLQTRFVVKKPLSIQKSAVIWNDEKTGRPKVVFVPIYNRKKELCLFGSLDPTQSIVIPFSYFHTMDKEKDTILLGELGDIKITYQDILDEGQTVRDNMLARHRDLYPGGGAQCMSVYLTARVVNIPRMRRIADRIIGDAATQEEAIRRIMDYSAKNLAYISDHKKDLRSGKNTPREIPMSPLMALMNRGEDCEGHAHFAASLFFSTSNPIVGDNSMVGLATLAYVRNGKGIGHAIPLIPKISKYVTDPFPNHIIANGIPFGYFEATGAGYDELHRMMPQLSGYVPENIMIIRGNGRNRVVEIAGFNQFDYLQGKRLACN
ncbi:hypothetical protein J7J13_00210 [bacterium]|nr:hypothetical protein [bacterium]